MARQRWRARRVLHPVPIWTLDEYANVGGGRGLTVARTMPADEVVARITDSGLRGRGGAGFPVGAKWATLLAERRRSGYPPVIVVNAAEGEPGTFKDRSILRSNPYSVIEGALICAHVLDAHDVIIATKRSFTDVRHRLEGAVNEVTAAGWSSARIQVFDGPDEYLYGEESALLETLDGRGPFPRVAPPYRVGLIDELAWRGVTGSALVNNVESMANVAKIVARGPAWFRRIGTVESPGSSVITITGDRMRHGVAEVRLGTPLRTVLRAVGGPLSDQPAIKAVLSGVANPVLPAAALAAPISYEGLRRSGGGMGSGGFIVINESTDIVAVAAGVARFLSVESCGQCSPCKLDGLLLAEVLTRLCHNEARPGDLDLLRRRSVTVSYGARCFLAQQHEIVLTSLFERFWNEFEDHAARRVPPVERYAIAELYDIIDGQAVLDPHFDNKRPDWGYGQGSSGCTPVERRNELTASSSPVELTRSTRTFPISTATPTSVVT